MNSPQMKPDDMSDSLSIASSKSNKKQMEDYESVQPPDSTKEDLGKGAFGAVKLVKEKNTGKL